MQCKRPVCLLYNTSTEFSKIVWIRTATCNIQWLGAVHWILPVMQSKPNKSKLLSLFFQRAVGSIRDFWRSKISGHSNFIFIHRIGEFLQFLCIILYALMYTYRALILTQRSPNQYTISALPLTHFLFVKTDRINCVQWAFMYKIVFSSPQKTFTIINMT